MFPDSFVYYIILQKKHYQEAKHILPKIYVPKQRVSLSTSNHSHILPSLSASPES